MSQDGRRNNGGHKTAGRKPKIDEIKLIEKLSPLEEKAFKALTKGLDAGDFPFVKLYFEYRFGKAKESLDITTNGDNVNIPVVDWVNGSNRGIETLEGKFKEL